MAVPRLDNRSARWLFLDRHALSDAPAGPGKGDDLHKLIQKLGFVQLDSINTVARAHDLILFARRPAYRPRNLKNLYEKDRALFEHWTHDAAVIPMEYYRHWHLRFRRDAEMLKNRLRNWQGDAYQSRFNAVLQHIRDHGPVGSSDVGTDEKRSNGGWWDWHPSKTALEYLWRSGALTVVGREGFQKRYDLTERVIDETFRHPAQSPADDETIDWKCNAALDRLGFATSGELAAFWDTVSAAEAKDWCAQQVKSGRLIPAEIACDDGSWRKVLCRPETVEEVAELSSPTGRMRVLSPFDPALRDRKRAERLFGFHYRIEVFVPAAQRKFGYYVFPLLEGDRIVGRIDMKAPRDVGELRVAAVWPERGVRWGKARQEKLESELARICRLAGVETVQFADGWLRDPV